jgi:hypothetical protein
MNCERRCEAPEHSQGCPCKGCLGRLNCRKTTDDHFTPRVVQKLTKIKDTRENHQWLSVPCHRAKDLDTPLRAQVLRMEKKGVILTFEQHRGIFNGT